MQQVLKRVAQQRFPGVRLVQTAYHTRSLSLYTKLGFEPRELLSIMQGQPLNLQIPGYVIRSATDRMSKDAGMPEHPNFVVVALSDYAVKIIFLDGKTEEGHGKAGQVTW